MITPTEANVNKVHLCDSCYHYHLNSYLNCCSILRENRTFTCGEDGNICCCNMYTPDTISIEKAVWDFVTELLSANIDELEALFNCDFEDIYTNYSYQEVKDKYNAWKKEKEIKIGDEVQYELDGEIIKFVVFGKFADDDCYYGYNIANATDPVWDAWEVMRGVTKTGRHFNEVGELLRKIENKENE